MRKAEHLEADDKKQCCGFTVNIQHIFSLKMQIVKVPVRILVVALVIVHHSGSCITIDIRWNIENLYVEQRNYRVSSIEHNSGIVKY